MNSDRYSPDDLTSDHDEDVAAEQQQPKSAPEKPNPAKPNRAKKKDTDKVTGATRRKKSPPKKTSARVRRTDSDKMADKVTEKVTGKAGGKAKANAATTTKIGSVKGGPVRAEEKRPARRTATNRVGKTALSKDAVMRAMAKQELVASNAAERQALKLEQDQANSAALRKELKAKQSKTPAEIGGQGVIWSLLALGLAACGGGGTKFISGPTVNVPKLPDDEVSSAELAASEAARAKAEAARDKAAQELGETRNELETTKDNLGETTTDLEFTLNQLLGSAGVVRKGLPRNAKIYLLNENLERDGEHIAVTDVDGRFDISGLTLDQKRQLLKYGFEADLSEASDLVARSGNEMYGLGFDDSVNTTDVVAAGTTVTLKYRLVDGHGVESSEYEISFRFSAAPSNEPAVEPSGASFGQEHVDDNIPDNKPGTNEDEGAPDPADAERKSVTGNGIEQDVDDGMPLGLNDNFQTVSMDF